MANAKRLIFFLAGFVLTFAAGLAFADDYPASSYWYNTKSPTTHVTTADLACRVALEMSSSYPGTYGDAKYPGTGTSCLWQDNASGGWYNAGVGGGSVTTAYECPYGGTISGTTCVNAPACDAGETRGADGLCAKDCTNMAGRIAGRSNSYAVLGVEDPRSYNGSQSFCVEGCAAVAQGGVACQWNNDANGDMISLGAYCMGTGPFQFNGRTCDSYGGQLSEVTDFGTENETKPWYDSGEDAQDCSANGGAYGEVNGVYTCVGAGAGTSGIDGGTKAGSETKAPTTSTTTNPDGSSTTTTTEETTSCTGSLCSTTTTKTTETKDASGNTTGTETTTEKKEQAQPTFCEQNPKSAVCVGTEGDKSAWSGTCSAGFTCTGDAVDCAIARASWEETCATAWMREANDLATLGQAGVDAVSSISEADAAAALNKDGSFDWDISEVYQQSQQSYITYTSECIHVEPIEVMGATLNFDTGILCDVGTFIRVMMHILAYLGLIRAFSLKL